MCKFCQSCLETLYWHLIEKRFCYDESIALYEEPQVNEKEKNNNMFDNMAFYDSVAVIAGRAIVTIEPLPEKFPSDKQPIIKQPSRSKVRWLGEEDEENKTNEEKSKQFASNGNIPNILILEDVIDGKDLLNTVEETPVSKETPEYKEKEKEGIKEENDVNHKCEVRFRNQRRKNASHEFISPDLSQMDIYQKNENSQNVENQSQSNETLASDTSTDNKPKPNEHLFLKKGESQDRLNKTSDLSTTKSESKDNLLKPEEPVKIRKKSLKERRMSKCASLNFDHIYKLELPMVKQNSMPRFYLDTPDDHQLDSAIARAPSIALSSPIQPKSEKFSYDLRSIVEIQKEQLNLNHLNNNNKTQVHKENNHHSFHKLVQIARLSKIKKHASTNSLPNTVNHI